MDITSYLISIDVNSTLSDEANAPIQNSLECQHENGHFFKMSYHEQRQIHTQIESYNSKVVVVKLHTKEQNIIIYYGRKLLWKIGRVRLDTSVIYQLELEFCHES